MRILQNPTKPAASYRQERGSAFVATLAPHLSQNTPEFQELADRAATFLDDGKDAQTMAETIGCDASLVRTVCLLRSAPAPHR